MNWLILGEGPMLKADAIEESAEDTEKVEQILELIQKNSENLLAEIKSLTRKSNPKPYPEPPTTLNMVAED